jgi:hypothetical protein
MDRCPSCRGKPFHAVYKLLMNPWFPRQCNNCGAELTMSHWYHLAVIPLIAALFAVIMAGIGGPVGLTLIAVGALIYLAAIVFIIPVRKAEG